MFCSELSALCPTCCLTSGYIGTSEPFAPDLGAGPPVSPKPCAEADPRPERTAEDRRLHKRRQGNKLPESKRAIPDGVDRRKLAPASG
jgi:hypothetical protein